MKTIQLGSLVTLVLLCGAAYAVPPHSLTYSQVSVAPGTQVTIGGEQFIAVQVPMRQFTVDSHYAVRFLTPMGQDGSVFAFLTTTHSTDPLPSTNATIDGFPALIQVIDGRTYSISTELDPNTFEPTNMFRAVAGATVTVQIKVGDTLLSFFDGLNKTDHEVDLGLNEYRATGQAAYGKYLDPVALMGAQGLDKWVDYIRVIPLN
jgi:hypothetical protein